MIIILPRVGRTYQRGQVYDHHAGSGCAAVVWAVPEVPHWGLGMSPDAVQAKRVRLRPGPVTDLADGEPGAPGANVVTMVVPYVIIL